MSAVQTPPVLPIPNTKAQPVAPNEPRTLKWTREEFYRAAGQGFFEGKRVLLLAGEVIEVPGQGNWHCVSCGKTHDALQDAFPRRKYWIRCQQPLDLPDGSSEPEPDIAVVPGQPDQFIRHPETAVLVVETSDSSLRLDRRKASAYAFGGVSDYWIVNLQDHVVEVYRDPIHDRTAEFGMRYGSVSTLKPGQKISPLAAPHTTVAVSDLLPGHPVGNSF